MEQEKVIKKFEFIDYLITFIIILLLTKIILGN